MELIFDGENMPPEKVTDYMQAAAGLVLEREGVSNQLAEISVTFTDSEEIREINRDFRDIDKVTDVLSFPQFESPEEIPKAGPYALGDVVICTQQAKAQAEEYGHSCEREMVYLFVHSMFHLMGYDHMEADEKRQMRTAEEDVMGKLDLSR